MYHVIISCEHAKNKIPKQYEPFFRDAGSLLSSHRGYDIGALCLAKQLAAALAAPLFITEVSRLLVDCNRSIHNPKIFSECVKVVSKKEKSKIIDRYYRPYRDRVEGVIQDAVSIGKKVVHFSVHTFISKLGGMPRDFDIGILYDPHRDSEALFARCLLQVIRASSYEKDDIFANIRNSLNMSIGIEGCCAFANKPYKGTADGFTTYLRKRFPQNYIGIEIEVNQNYFN